MDSQPVKSCETWIHTECALSGYPTLGIKSSTDNLNSRIKLLASCFRARAAIGPRGRRGGGLYRTRAHL
ncbi:hypothetical protein EVAR_3481_1 [Eumeta japonica]|uniref:Uncharacterized protein n=1 Tax=Eumeta variegata TaxID=151549 RepID=A0A4C1SSG0_EUMVA|nr:hypothetical protein EVAR_3481_1 [Eumeta japonica]